MKLSNFVIIFTIIAACLLIPIKLQQKMQAIVTVKQTEYNNCIDNAVDDALLGDAVEYDSGNRIFVNKDIMTENFFRSLYNSFGVVGNANAQDLIRLYVPVLLYTDTSGYYIYSAHEYATDGEHRTEYKWSEKRKYAYDDTANNLLVVFTLGDFVSVYNKETNEKVEGNYQDIKEIYPDVDYFNDYDEFNETRCNCIINHIVPDMEYYVNAHNTIAKRYGIEYNFELPYIQDTDWYRTIDDISLLAVFQGYPYSDIGAGGYFNRYAIGSARIKKESYFYISTIDGVPYYHREDCDDIDETDKKKVYFSMKECAQNGAYPHDCCR